MKNAKMLTILVLGLVVCLPMVSEAEPMGTAWTYQGRLMDSNSPADGEYDFTFKLYDAYVGGNKAANDVNVGDVDVIDGYFTVELDFGSDVFDGNARWLEIGVRPGESTGGFTTLSPRQEVTPMPYALQTRGIFVDPNGNVGIGTRSPASRLHVATPSTYSDIIYSDGSGKNDLSVDLNSAYTGDIDRIYIVEVTDSEGGPEKFKWSDDNGATWSSEDLEMTTSWYDLSHGVRIRWDDTDGHSDGTEEPLDVWAWVAYRGYENALVVTDRKVGIGTSSPAWELDVTNLTAGDGAEIGVTANDASGAIAAYSSTLGFPFEHYAGRVSLFAGMETPGLDLRADGGAGDMRFYSGGPWPANERMRITASGNVGIGMTSPTSKLHVTGSSSDPILTVTNSGSGRAVYGKHTSSGNQGYLSSSEAGVGGGSDSGIGLYGVSSTGKGVYGWSLTGDGVYGASGSGWAGFFAGKVYMASNVGIGTANPVYRLDVEGGGARITNQSDGAVVLDLNTERNWQFRQLGTGLSTALELASVGGGGNKNFIINTTGNVGIGTSSPEEELTVRGNILLENKSTGAPVLELGEGLDYAEGFDVSGREEINAGSVLIIDADNPGKLALSNKSYDTKVAGIVAGGKGLGSGVRLGAGQFDYDVALAGRVYCKVDATDEAIQAGDLLTTSATPGYAMKAVDYMRAQGAILGKAMESLEQGQKGQILVLVTLQ